MVFNIWCQPHLLIHKDLCVFVCVWGDLGVLHTLCVTVVFVSGCPAQLNAPLSLIGQFEVGGRIRFLCRKREAAQERRKQRFLICFCSNVLFELFYSETYD